MSEAPERIKIESECGHANTYSREDRRTWLDFPDNAPDYFYAEYVRADRIEELEAKLAKAVEALRNIDALDPEAKASACSHPALAGTVQRMGSISRTTLAELTGGNDE